MAGRGSSQRRLVVSAAARRQNDFLIHPDAQLSLPTKHVEPRNGRSTHRLCTASSTKTTNVRGATDRTEKLHRRAGKQVQLFLPGLESEHCGIRWTVGRSSDADHRRYG
uniref:(northern house mosquito) hypothetical protein n=1 Tax=Culex pipiens TaxID=7175 RepID=A0A8D8CZK7_CULPI